MTKDRRSKAGREAVASRKRVEMREQVMELIVGAGVKAIQGMLAGSVFLLCGERYARRPAEEPRRDAHETGGDGPGLRAPRTCASPRLPGAAIGRSINTLAIAA